MRNGKSNSQMNGYAIRASTASGQQRTKRMHQSRKANMTEISFSLNNCTFAGRKKFRSCCVRKGVWMTGAVIQIACERRRVAVGLRRRSEERRVGKECRS